MKQRIKSVTDWIRRAGVSVATTLIMATVAQGQVGITNFEVVGSGEGHIRFTSMPVVECNQTGGPNCAAGVYPIGFGVTCVYSLLTVQAAPGSFIESVVGASLPPPGHRSQFYYHLNPCIYLGPTVTVTVRRLESLVIDVAGDGVVTTDFDDTVSTDGGPVAIEIDRGTPVVLTATPLPGAQFVRWEGEGCGGTGPCTVTMHESRTVRAVFTYPLTIQHQGFGTGTVIVSPADGSTSFCGSFPCTYAIEAETAVELAAIPSISHAFVGWSGAVSGDGPVSVQMSGPRTVNARFSDGQYRVTVTPSGSGTGLLSISPPGVSRGTLSDPIDAGTEVTVTALPAGNSDFTGWIGGPCDGQTGSCTFTMPDANVGFSAGFSSRGRTYIASTTGGGTIISSDGGINCGAGGSGDCTESYFPLVPGSVTFTAVPASGATFVGWEGICELNGTGPCAVQTNFGPMVNEVVARFAVPLNLQFAGTGGGTVTSDTNVTCSTGCTETYPGGQVVTLQAMPDAHSEFTGWSGGCSGTGDCTVTLDEARQVTATFARAMRTVIVHINGEGTLVEPGLACSQPNSQCTFSVPSGDFAYFQAQPAPGFRVGGWSNTSCFGQGCGLQVNSDVELSVLFVPDFYFVHLTTSEGGRIEIDPIGTTCEGDCFTVLPGSTEISLTPIPEPGYQHVGWTQSNACSGIGACRLTLSDSLAARAEFAPVSLMTVATRGVNNGSGSVRSTDMQIDCRGCEIPFHSSTATLTLQAIPDAGSTFLGWRGACQGTGDCTIDLQQSRSVAAVFRRGSGNDERATSALASNYTLIGPAIWNDLEAQAIAMGGHQVTINDAIENEFIRSTYLPQMLTRGLYIGFTDDGHEGDWQWASGEEVTYTNWRDGEPNNDFNGCEHHAEMSPDGGWNDRDGYGRCTPRSHAEHFGVVEVPLSCGDQPSGQWISPGGGLWSNGGNWLNGILPSGTLSAEFDLGSAYAVDIGGDRSIPGLVVDDTVSLNLQGLALTLGPAATSTCEWALLVGRDPADSGHVEIGPGLVNYRGLGRLGFGPGSEGSMTLNGAALVGTGSGNIVAGGAGTGTLTIGGTASINGSALDLYAGDSDAAHGNIVLQTGAGVSIRRLVIGNRGSGSFSAAGFSGLVAQQVHLGSAFGGLGEATFSGTGSSLSLQGDEPRQLLVGRYGDGTLSLVNDAAATLDGGQFDVVVGHAGIGHGMLIVGSGATVGDGDDRLLAASEVGADAQVELSDNSVADMATILIGLPGDGRFDGGVAVVTVESGATLRANAMDPMPGDWRGLSVGNRQSDARLSVLNGGRVETTAAHILGTFGPAEPSVLVSGEDSVFECNGMLHIAGLGEALMACEDGGLIDATSVRIGGAERGRLSLSGAGLRLQVSGILEIGSALWQDAGVLSLGDGAQVQCETLFINNSGGVEGGSGPGGAAIIVVGEPLAVRGGSSDILCGTLLTGAGAILDSYDLQISQGAVIGGAGTWPASVEGNSTIQCGVLGQAGDFTIDGDFSPGATSSVEVGLGLINPHFCFCTLTDSVRVHNGLVVNGHAALAGTLHVNHALLNIPFFGGYYNSQDCLWPDAAFGVPFEVVSAETLSGAFDSVVVGDDMPHCRLRADYDYPAGRVVVTMLPPCLADFNGDTEVDSQDFFDFIEAFFNGDADVNGVDGTDSQDYFDFLEAFFGGCEGLRDFSPLRGC